MRAAYMSNTLNEAMAIHSPPLRHCLEDLSNFYRLCARVFAPALQMHPYRPP